ncbi:MAG: aminomethyl-transferring glycine dehydrogenase [Dysgonamonadaceae bacterium]|jgi:glycine dehydrogenase|nr:aminomethyl-transferring glycine dehydrogenase [Dysgonamonadaceae bacterium]
MTTEKFANRHIGITKEDTEQMLRKIGVSSVEQLIDETIPQDIRLKETVNLPEAMTEREYAEHIAELASKNEIFTSYIGMGWYDTIIPAPILRNVFENPVWYTSYTPYQAEISQGRLEALLNFQTLISDLTALPLSNCSLLDEGTAAAEAANMMFNARSREQLKNNCHELFVDERVFESTWNVIRTVVTPLGITAVRGDYQTFSFTANTFGAILQYPDANGNINDYTAFTQQAAQHGIKVAVAADILSLALLTPPGEWGADIVFGSSQRLGIPMYFGGPSAGYLAVKEEYKRIIPGRIIGISKDASGKPALRMALQTREQHIKREKATSNICTAQALLASMAGFYAVYHGPEGIKNIAERIHAYAGFLSAKLNAWGYQQLNENFFDTLKIRLPENVSVQSVQETALECKVNFRYFDSGEIGISIDETTLPEDIGVLLYIFSSAIQQDYLLQQDIEEKRYFDARFVRTTSYLTHPVFNAYHTETELMRYIKRLDRKDISLAHSMISLGSCTMKLNAASEMLPLSRPEFANIHPYAPEDQRQGYTELIDNLSVYLGAITGLPGISFQPNSGAAGEYSGLMTIRSFQQANGQGQRNLVLIPEAAHGTNPASAARAGYLPINVRCDENGNTDIEDLRAKANEHKDHLAAFMITYPSTHGIFETAIREMCRIVHDNGGQVYMDGANMNAQVGHTHPGFIGADVCHLNLHKTFAIPHGGGGPGEGPICVAQHLIPFLPDITQGEESDRNVVASSPFGSAGILPITYGYIRMMGAEGLRDATAAAIINANYLAACLKDAYGIVYRGAQGRVGHELILECRSLKETGITETDIAKRLIDYGFHAPTLSFPVHGTLMIEPTESESLKELDRFAEALLSIRKEIEEVDKGDADKTDNVLVNAPHPEYEITADEWTHSYPRSKAAYPLEWLRENKFWVNVGRVDNAFGDRNLIAKVKEE